MKKIFAVLALVAAVVFVVMASDFPPSTANNTQNATLLSATTNQTGSALYVEAQTQHTVQIVNTTIRTNTCYLDRSLDGSNWVPCYTNVFTTTGTVDTAISGKYAYLRGRLDTLTGTNCAVTFIYLGGK